LEQNFGIFVQVSDRDHTTNMGATNNDEMCNYYIMFYFEAGTE
jgi:hypothetical protein